MKWIEFVRAATRGTRLVIHLGAGACLASIYRLYHGLHWHQAPAGQAIIHWWMRRATRIVGLHITSYGQPLRDKALLVCNHISFLDILAVSSVLPVRFLAKHTIRQWPVIGYLSRLSGCLFIERGKRQEIKRSLHCLRHALGHGTPVLIFPEGTTSLGESVLAFYTGLFQAALDARVPVQALTLHYRHDDRADRLAAYIDTDNFLVSLLRLMTRDRTEVHLSFTPPIDSQGHTRRSLSAFCHARISQNLCYQLQYHAWHKPLDAATQFAILGECKP